MHEIRKNAKLPSEDGRWSMRRQEADLKASPKRLLLSRTADFSEGHATLFSLISQAFFRTVIGMVARLALRSCFNGVTH